MCAGHTYERSEIEEWLKVHDTSPLTNKKLPNLTLTPNFLIRHILDKFSARVP